MWSKCVRHEDRIDFGGIETDLRQNIPGRMPGLNTEVVGHDLAIVPLILADPHRHDVPFTLDDDIGIGQADNPGCGRRTGRR
jgi:hypothetical protein